MEFANLPSSKMMNAEDLSLDIISTLPQPVIEYILSLMPLRDAVRTSCLATKWRYCWRSIPKLVFENQMVIRTSVSSSMPHLISAILHVLLWHKGPTSVEFYCSTRGLESDFDFMTTHLSSTVKTVNRFKFVTQGGYYYIHHTFFDLQGLEYIYLRYCYFRSPSTFSGFKKLRKLMFCDVEITAETFLGFLSQCPLLDELALFGVGGEFDLSGVDKFTFVELLQCVPLIDTLVIWKNYMEDLCKGGMPHKLPASLFYLKILCLHLCLMDLNEISAALCIIRSSPVVEEICLVSFDYETLPAQQTPTKFLDPKNYSDLKLDHLAACWIRLFKDSPLEVELVKLIMAKSPVLETLRIELLDNISDDQKLMMHTDLMQFPRASPFVELVIEDFDFSYWFGFGI